MSVGCAEKKTAEESGFGQDAAAVIEPDATKSRRSSDDSSTEPSNDERPPTPSIEDPSAASEAEESSLKTLTVPQLLAETMRALQTDDQSTAYRLSREAMYRASDDPQTRFTYGLVLGSRKRFPEAIQLLDQVGEEMPQAKLPALGQTAEWMVQFGRYDEAYERFQAVLKAVPSAAIAHESLAQLLIRQGRRLEAREHMEFLCQSGQADEFLLRSMLCYLRPFAGDAKNQLVDPIGPLGGARNKIANDEWKQAEELLRESQTETLAAPQRALLRRCVAAQWVDASGPRTGTFSEQDAPPSHADGWFADGIWLFGNGEFEKARDRFVRCVLLDPTDAAAYALLAGCLKEIGDE
ncbi:MAG: tetratricopeptide repeat protein, partial [Planctomycetota bacterium]